MELKQLAADTTLFECGGKKYRIDKTLSFNRFEKLREFSLEFGFSANLTDIMKGLRKAWDQLNVSKFAETAVSIHNLMTGIVNLEQKNDISLRIASLFINEESEDITVYNEEAMNDKIAIWGKELDVAFFFTFAISIVPSFIPCYRIITQAFSLNNELTQKINESIPKDYSEQ
jgi:hypothetical protein